MIPWPLFFKVWICIIGGRQMLSIAILTAIYLLLNSDNNIARMIFKALQSIALKTICNLVYYVINTLNVHIEKLRGGDLHHRPVLLFFGFVRSCDEVMHSPQHFASGGFLSVLPKNVQVLGDELFSCNFFGRFLEECYILILQHGGYSSSMPSMPASSSVLGALSLGIAEPDTVRVIDFLSES